MTFLTPALLAPVRTRLRIGANFYRLRAPMDLTVMSLLEIQRDARLLDASEDPEERVALFFAFVQAIFLDELEGELPVEDCLDAIAVFFDQLKPADGEEPEEADSDPDFGLPAARLASQYGGGMWHWLAEAPLPVYNHAMRLLGPLQAEESMGLVTVGAMGGGHVEKYAAQDIMADWRRIARALHEPEKREPDSMAETAARFALAGQAVEIF